MSVDRKMNGKKRLGAVISAFCAWILISTPDCCGQNRNQNLDRPDPTQKDVHYGSHENQVFDLWLAESNSPTPLVIYIHGGGFRGGSKNGIKGRTVKKFLAAGLSVASVEYRFVPEFPLPAAHRDCKRAIQFFRLNAKQWNLDKTRFGAYGGSAGAQLCMWLAFHDDMADPTSDDASMRESTRLACISTNGGQSTMDFEWWKKWIPGYDKPHRDMEEYYGGQSADLTN